jgi:glycosyltransferase involved in cell wall biosynthesis
MHVIFVHQNFPAQFGHIGERLARQEGWKVTFVTNRSVQLPKSPIEVITYAATGGATSSTHFLSRTFENAIAHTQGVYNALKARPDLKPDLIVGHSGFGSTLFLSQLYACPIINYFEFFYHTHGTDLDFRPDFPTTEEVLLRAQARNAMLLLDMENCAAGYMPTRWQASLFPQPYQAKVQVIFDGVDTQIWKRHADPGRTFGNLTLPPNAPVVTYVSRGFESMRGFDIFMKAARRIAIERPDVHFVIVGEDRCCYGDDQRITGNPSFKEWVLSQAPYPRERFHFTGRLAPPELAR